ncbi:uncharacterized protein LOC113345772 [Papaver somniferum]|uniref:uncharacterized protein LOC113345772 n=1 Tax=Papaver somniferum TaxID=3469 RepID=UPI000E6F6153|nr:uncharacterized protein LOC113345772 [Papaver somniferum]
MAWQGGSRLNLLGFKKMDVHNSTLSTMGNLWILWSEDVDDPLVVNTSRQAITVSLNGNFHCVLRTDEEKGGREPRTSCINEFSDWMDDNELFKADALGANFTWANGQSGVRRIISKSYRVIINEAWLNKFSNWRCKALPTEVSDHSTLAQLRLENALRISDEDHSDESKFNTSKDALAKVQGRNQQNIMLKQKSRNKWLLEGSSNTSYFHNNINIRKGRTTISELVSDDGSVISDSALLCDHIVNYYEAKFNGDYTIIDDLLFDYERPSITAE